MMKTFILFWNIILLFTVIGCLPDSLEKWNTSPTKTETVLEIDPTKEQVLDANGDILNVDKATEDEDDAPTELYYDSESYGFHVGTAITTITPTIVGADDEDTFVFSTYDHINSDPENGTGFKSIEELGLTIDQSTGVISGTPTKYASEEFLIYAYHVQSGKWFRFPIEDTTSSSNPLTITTAHTIEDIAYVQDVGAKLILQLDSSNFDDTDEFLEVFEKGDKISNIDGTIATVNYVNENDYELYIEITASSDYGFRVDDEIDDAESFVILESTITEVTFAIDASSPSMLPLEPKLFPEEGLGDNTEELNSISWAVSPDPPSDNYLEFHTDDVVTSTSTLSENGNFDFDTTGVELKSMESTTFTVVARNAIDETFEINIRINISEPPAALSYTKRALLTVDDDSFFSIGKAISSNEVGGSGSGQVIDVLDTDPPVIAIKIAQGEFKLPDDDEETSKIDNVASYEAERTTVEEVIPYSFRIQLPYRTNPGTNDKCPTGRFIFDNDTPRSIGQITYQDDDQIYIRYIVGQFTQYEVINCAADNVGFSDVLDTSKVSFSNDDAISILFIDHADNVALTISKRALNNELTSDDDNDGTVYGITATSGSDDIEDTADSNGDDFALELSDDGGEMLLFGDGTFAKVATKTDDNNITLEMQYRLNGDGEAVQKNIFDADFTGPVYLADGAYFEKGIPVTSNGTNASGTVMATGADNLNKIYVNIHGLNSYSTEKRLSGTFNLTFGDGVFANDDETPVFEGSMKNDGLDKNLLEFEVLDGQYILFSDNTFCQYDGDSISLDCEDLNYPSTLNSQNIFEIENLTGTIFKKIGDEDVNLNNESATVTGNDGDTDFASELLAGQRVIISSGVNGEIHISTVKVVNSDESLELDISNDSGVDFENADMYVAVASGAHNNNPQGIAFELSGQMNLTYNSDTVIGENTKFKSQLSVGQYIHFNTDGIPLTGSVSSTSGILSGVGTKFIDELQNGAQVCFQPNSTNTGSLPLIYGEIDVTGLTDTATTVPLTGDDFTGKVLRPCPVILEVDSIESDTELTLTANYGGINFTGVTASLFTDKDNLTIQNTTDTKVIFFQDSLNIDYNLKGQKVLFANDDDDAVHEIFEFFNSGLTYATVKKNHDGEGLDFNVDVTVADDIQKSIYIPNDNQNQILSVAFDNSFIIERGKSTVINPDTYKGDNLFYTISPKLPDGLEIDNKTGFITGSPTEPSIRSRYVIRAANAINYVDHSIFIKVYDSISITNTTENAPSYIMHKEGIDNNLTNCSISDDQINSGNRMAKQATCILNAGELDLFYSGIQMDLSVGPGMCEWTSFRPYAYYHWRYDPTPGTVIYVNTYEDTCINCGTETCTSLRQLDPDSAYCQSDYSNLGDDTNHFPNCDDGSYTLITTNYADEADDGDCVAEAPSETNVDCGGSRVSCMDGGVKDIGLEDNSISAGIDSIIFPSSYGLNTESDGSGDCSSSGCSWQFSDPFSQGLHTNMRLSNYSNINTCGSDNPYRYETQSVERYSRDSYSSQHPFSSNSPFYTFTCMDSAYDVIAKINIIVKDWDREFDYMKDLDRYFNHEYTSNSLGDSRSNIYMDNNNSDEFSDPWNDKSDWDDYWYNADSSDRWDSASTDTWFFRNSGSTNTHIIEEIETVTGADGAVTINATNPREINITDGDGDESNDFSLKIETGQTIEVDGQQRMVISVGNDTLTVATPFYFSTTLDIEIAATEYTVYRHNPYPMSGR